MSCFFLFSFFNDHFPLYMNLQLCICFWYKMMICIVIRRIINLCSESQKSIIKIDYWSQLSCLKCNSCFGNSLLLLIWRAILLRQNEFYVNHIFTWGKYYWFSYFLLKRSTCTFFCWKSTSCTVVKMSPLLQKDICLAHRILV